MRRHRADDSVGKAINRLIRADLIVIDDIGMLPVAADAAEALFRVVDAAYEKLSIALTSNTFTRPALTSWCPKPWRPRLSTGSCTTRTSCSPTAPTATA